MTVQQDTLSDKLSTSGLTNGRHLVAVPSLDYDPCPRWCSAHSDKGGVRVHTGPAEVVVGSALVMLSVEVHDDGRGNVRQVFWLTAGGVDVELSTGRMHDMKQAMDRVFWKLDRSGNFLGSDPVLNEFRNGVRDRLRAVGISQAQLAREAHVSPSMLSLILSGERVASAPVARAIETALDAHVSITSLAREGGAADSPQPRRVVRRSARDNRGGRA